MSKLYIYGDLGISQWELLLEMERHVFIDGVAAINTVVSSMFSPDIFAFLENADLEAEGRPFISYGPTNAHKSQEIKNTWGLLCERLHVDGYCRAAGWLILDALGKARLCIIKAQQG